MVCEDIERSGRDTYNALKLERELGGSDILLFATDEPLDMEGTEPATILLRRTKQNMAEYFRLQLKQKMWRGMRTHAEQGYNLGKVLDGYLPDKIPHPVPDKAAHGRTKTRLTLDEMRAPLIAAIYDLRAWQKLGVPTIHARLCADPGAYPPADPETGWTTGGIYSILANPKYTGHQVFGRVRKGKRVTPDKWYWSDQPTHPAIVDRDTWEPPSGRRGASQLPGRGDRQSGHLADLPVPVPDPLQDLQTPDVRAAETAPGPQERPRVLLLRVPVQPEHCQPRRRRPRPSPHRPGPRRPAAGRDAAGAGRLRAGPRPRTAPRPAHPLHGHREEGTARPAGRRPPTSGSSASSRRRTT